MLQPETSILYRVSKMALLSGTYSMISIIEQFNILHNASSVFVETDSFAFNRLIVELLISPFT